MSRSLPRRIQQKPGSRAARNAFALLLAAGFLAAAPPPAAQARTGLSILPDREATQVTVYHGEDLTLVREARTLTFAEGLNTIQFSWANTLIDPTSLDLMFPGGGEGEFEIADITYPAGTRDLLVWNVRARRSGPAPVEIRYFLSGLSWNADYLARANADETHLAIEGYARLENRSGEDIERAQVRLVVGEAHLVEAIADLARRGILPQPPFTVSRGDVWRVKSGEKTEAPNKWHFGAAYAFYDESGGMGGGLKDVLKQSVSEYQLYTIEGTESLGDGWAKRLRFFQAADVKAEVAYEFDERKHGPEAVKYYALRNDTEHGLGAHPLPEGAWRALRESGGGAELAWVGERAEKYLPIGEKMELFWGSDGLMIVEPRMTDFERRAVEFDAHGNVTGHDTVETWEIEIRNAGDRAAPLRLRRYFSGDWTAEPLDGAPGFRKVDHETLEWEFPVEARSTVKIAYRVTLRHGSRESGASLAGPPPDPPAAKRTPRPVINPRRRIGGKESRR